MPNGYINIKDKFLPAVTTHGIDIDHSFVWLSDTPTTYSGHSGEYLRVLPTESGIEFASVSGVGVNEGAVECFRAESTNQSSTTSTSYNDKVLLNFTPQTAGYFKINYACLQAHADTGVFYKMRIAVDDSNYYQESYEEFYNFKYEDGAWRIRSGVFSIYLDASPHSVKLQYCSDESGKAAYIKEAYVTVKRLVLTS